MFETLNLIQLAITILGTPAVVQLVKEHIVAKAGNWYRVVSAVAGATLLIMTSGFQIDLETVTEGTLLGLLVTYLVAIFKEKK